MIIKVIMITIVIMITSGNRGNSTEKIRFI